MDQLHSCPDMEEHVLSGVAWCPKKPKTPAAKDPFEGRERVVREMRERWLVHARVPGRCV